MLNRKKIGMIFGTLVSLALSMHGCGGGGGGGGAPSAQVSSKSAAAASKATTGVLGLASTSTHSGGSAKPSLQAKGSVDLSQPAQIRQALQKFKASLASRRQKGSNKVTNLVNKCTEGEFHVVVDDKDTADPLDDSITENFDNCTTLFDNGTPTDTTDDLKVVENGSLKHTTNTAGGFTLTFTNYTTQTTGSFGVEEVSSNGTVSFSGNDLPCGETSFIENGAFTVALSGTEKVDANKDGTFEVNDSFAFDNLKMAMTEKHTAAPACLPGVATTVMNGKATFSNTDNASESMSVTFTDFTTAATPATRNGIQGDTLSVSGTTSITSACVNGTFAMSTPAGEEPFLPTDAFCPVEGRFLVAAGGASTAIKFTPAGGVEIDEGNDGSVEERFTNCKEAGSCR
jgi:hypothetical protein